MVPNGTHLYIGLEMQIVGLGVDAYLKMLLIDNFVHTDLHPGNIFVRARVEPRVRIAGCCIRALLRYCRQLGTLPFCRKLHWLTMVRSASKILRVGY